MNRPRALLDNRIPSEVIGKLSPRTIATMITLYLTELGRPATEGEIWEELDPGQTIAWGARIHIFAGLLEQNRIILLQERDPQFPDNFRRTYATHITTNPALERSHR